MPASLPPMRCAKKARAMISWNTYPRLNITAKAAPDMCMRNRRAILCVGVGALLSCGVQDVPELDGSELPGRSGTSGTRSLRTDSSEYALREEESVWTTMIGFSYENSGEDTVYVVNCNGQVTMNLQKREEGEWQDVWSGETNACLSAPIVIPPGSTYEGELSIRGAEPGTSATSAFSTADLEGDFRLVWHQPVRHYDSRRPGFGEVMPLDERSSNIFSLRQRRDDR